LVAWYGFTVKPYGRLRGKVESIAERGCSRSRAALRPSDAAAGRFTFSGAPTASTRLCAAEAVEDVAYA